MSSIQSYILLRSMFSLWCSGCDALYSIHSNLIKSPNPKRLHTRPSKRYIQACARRPVPVVDHATNTIAIWIQSKHNLDTFESAIRSADDDGPLLTSSAISTTDVRRALYVKSGMAHIMRVNGKPKDRHISLMRARRILPQQQQPPT